MKPAPFANGDWVSLDASFLFKRSGIQTKRDDFVYSFSAAAVREKVTNFLDATDQAATIIFHDSRDRNSTNARKHPFNQANVIQASYRPFDRRHLYNHPAYTNGAFT
jgi:predicted helicase